MMQERKRHTTLFFGQALLNDFPTVVYESEMQYTMYKIFNIYNFLNLQPIIQPFIINIDFAMILTIILKCIFLDYFLPFYFFLDVIYSESL